MKKTYKIKVDCANCANLMEDAARRIAGVAFATVNFMTQKMIVEFEDGQDPRAVMKSVLKACKKVEPDCEVYLWSGGLKDPAPGLFDDHRIASAMERMDLPGFDISRHQLPLCPCHQYTIKLFCRDWRGQQGGRAHQRLQLYGNTLQGRICGV